MREKLVDVEDITKARDLRRRLQQEMIAENKTPLISFTMNIAGPIKRSALADLAFASGCRALKNALGEPKCGRLVDEPTGIEGLFAYDAPPRELKSVCTYIEENHPSGRLFDMDVIDEGGTKLSRREPRSCIICSGPAIVCSRSRAHGLTAITTKTKEILASGAAETISDAAVAALKREAHLTPKPGLVDEKNNGAHSDMNIELLDISAESLGPYFREAAMISFSHDEPIGELTEAGLRAESAMFEATHGVNTHKGAVYAFGLMIAAYVRKIASGDDMRGTIKALAALTGGGGPSTHGGLAKARYGARGARAEALAGYPSAFKAYEYMMDGGDELGALMMIMSELDDTNMYYRGGAAAAELARETGRVALHLSGNERLTFLTEADKVFTDRNLSPGGSADMLALAMFMCDMRYKEKCVEC